MNISLAQLTRQPLKETVSLGGVNNKFNFGQLSHWIVFPTFHSSLSEFKVVVQETKHSSSFLPLGICCVRVIAVKKKNLFGNFILKLLSQVTSVGMSVKKRKLLKLNCKNCQN